MRLQQHLNRFLLGYAVAAMALGLAFGYPAAAWSKQHSSLLSDLTTAGVFLIIFVAGTASERRPGARAEQFR